ncbi:MAG: hypothetical protein RL563_1956 [Pseudomonadota bacterium]
MIIDFDIETLFPEGLSDEAISAITDVLYELVMQWESKHYHQLKRFDKARQVDLIDPLEPWHRQYPS